MKVLDVNVVLAVHRDGHPQFDTARPWLDALLEHRSPFAVPDLVAGSFVRIATNRRIFAIPKPADEVFGFLRALRAQPGHVLLGPGPRHIELFESMCREGAATGDLVPDAQLAAITIEHAGEVVSFDRDFARFPGLRWTTPGA